MIELMLVKVVGIAGTPCLEFVGMFATREEAGLYIEHDSTYYILQAEQLFWEIADPTSKPTNK